MHSALRIGSGVTVLGLAALWGADARAQCTIQVYTPAAYTSAVAGDAALSTATSAIINSLTTELGMTYSHVAMVTSSAGNTFVESTWNGITTNGWLPSSKQTGDVHECNRVLEPFFLQRLYPGVTSGQRDALPGVLAKGVAKTTCTPPDGTYPNSCWSSYNTNYSAGYCTHDNYHINSIKNRHHGGSCAALAEDDCGVAVTGSWQRVFTSTQHYNTAMMIYGAAYSDAQAQCDANWPLWGIGCSGAPADGECNGTGCSCSDRAASQIVNEFVTQGCTEGVAGACNDGATNLSVYGEQLGDSKTPLAPGAYWSNNGSSWTPRVPDNVYASAQAHGKTLVPVGTAYGNIKAGYYTTEYANGNCCGCNCTGTCENGSCVGQQHGGKCVD